MKSYFVFDVESVGLHGEAFAVAGGVYLENGAAQWEFKYACPIDECRGTDEDRAWVKANVPALQECYRGPRQLRDAFWAMWMKAKNEGATMAADCLWPVEAGLVEACVRDEPVTRNWDGPYPFMEIASFLAAAGMDPLGKYERTPSELPVHDPLADARQSARMLSIALSKLSTCSL